MEKMHVIWFFIFFVLSLYWHGLTQPTKQC